MVDHHSAVTYCTVLHYMIQRYASGSTRSQVDTVLPTNKARYLTVYGVLMTGVYKAGVTLR